MADNSRVQLLQTTPFFGAVTDAAVSFILERAETSHCRAGDYYFRQGDRADSIYLLESGEVAILKQQQEQVEVLLRRSRQGHCFGELALIDLQPRSASVKAISDCQAINISAAILHALYQQDAEQFLIIQMNIARELCRRLRSADERLVTAIQ